MSVIVIPSLPVTEFAAFKTFAEAAPPIKAGADLPHRKVPLWTFAEAAAAAISVMHALGHPSLFDEPITEREARAFAWWLARFNSPEWTLDCEALIRFLGRGINSMCLAWDDDPTRGWDEAAWSPDYITVQRLNSWSAHMLDAFWRMQRAEDDPAGPEETAPPREELAATSSPPGDATEQHKRESHNPAETEATAMPAGERMTDLENREVTAGVAATTSEATPKTPEELVDQYIKARTAAECDYSGRGAIAERDKFPELRGHPGFGKTSLNYLVQKRRQAAKLPLNRGGKGAKG
jgi:hypothetical protein